MGPNSQRTYGRKAMERCSLYIVLNSFTPDFPIKTRLSLSFDMSIVAIMGDCQTLKIYDKHCRS